MVNVNSFNEQVPEGDKLELLFKRQRELMEKYHQIEEKNVGHHIPSSPSEQGPHSGPVDIQSREGQLRIKDFMWRVTEEIGEAANTLKLKPWKSTGMLTDETHFREEMIDALHFFVELLILAGFDAHSAVECYLNKNAVNQFRIKSNY